LVIESSPASLNPPETTNTAAANPAAPNATEAAADAVPGLDPAGIFPGVDAPSPANGLQTPPGGTNSVPTISPQMLLQFFMDHAAATNRDAAPIAPLHFTPALPPLPSSTATYTTGPKP
jgi:hypothetical protein